MNKVREILNKAMKQGIISIKEYNEGIYVYIIYRIVWETKSHYILYPIASEEEAKRIVARFKSNEYYYQKVRIN
jgi:hypothetical protein